MLRTSRSAAVLAPVVPIVLSVTACTADARRPVLDIVGEALPPLESLGQLAETYTAESGVEVRVHPFEFETALQRAQLDFVSHAGQYDLVMGIFYNHGRYYEAGYIIPFSDPRFAAETSTVPDSAFYPALRTAVMYYDSVRVGYPFSAQTMFLWYRKDLFTHPGEATAFEARYGYALPVPDEYTSLTWTEYRDLAEHFTRPAGATLADSVLDQPFYGNALQMRRHPSSFYEFTNYVYSFGGSFFDSSGRPVVNSAANRVALEFYMAMRAFAPPGALQATWDDALAQMQQGRVAMTIMWSDAPSALYDTTASVVAGKVGYSLVPVVEGAERLVSVFGGWGFLINADSPLALEAFRFVQWVSQPEQQLRWAKMGGLPGAASIFEDPEYMAIPYMGAQNEALKHLVFWPKDPNAEQFINSGIEFLSRATAGELTAGQALAALQAAAEQLYN